jgi:hypothetical protein
MTPNTCTTIKNTNFEMVVVVVLTKRNDFGANFVLMKTQTLISFDLQQVQMNLFQIYPHSGRMVYCLH